MSMRAGTSSVTWGRGRDSRSMVPGIPIDTGPRAELHPLRTPTGLHSTAQGQPALSAAPPWVVSSANPNPVRVLQGSYGLSVGVAESWPLPLRFVLGRSGRSRRRSALLHVLIVVDRIAKSDFLFICIADDQLDSVAGFPLFRHFAAVLDGPRDAVWHVLRTPAALLRLLDQ